ncbi:NAD-dependent epimerase/dehydratase family protein [Streptomyces sp. NPDC002537]
MKLLILGGTEFVGHAVAEAALTRGWEVTVFHRGRHEAPAGVTALHGDRTEPGGTAALATGEWDAVVDTWSAAPTAVRDAARTLAGRVGRYAYVSTGSVYAYPSPPGRDESHPLVDGSPDAGPVDYPQDKRGGELAATAAFGDDAALLVRSGLILGPRENIGRLPWWLNRVARGGPVLAPGPRGLELQFIDVRDLANWTLDAVAGGLSGPYDLISPPGHTTMGALLDACVRATGSDAELRWTDPEKILAAGVRPWTDLPVWVPRGELYDTLHRRSGAKAAAAGLRCRPAEETVADTWTWLRSLNGAAPLRPDRPAPGLSPELESRLLAQD